MIISKKTKIVATVGPASRSKDTIKRMAEAGANVLRLNFSHGSHDDHSEAIKHVREINQQETFNLALLQDLQGPKIRVGEVENDGVELIDGTELVITTQEMVGTSSKVSTVYPALSKDVKKGDRILLDDGNLEIKVLAVEGKEIRTQVVHGGILKSRKGINLPDSKVSAPSLTSKDIVDLEFGLKNNFDWVALSFVRTAADIIDLKERIKAAGKTTKVIAKIEKPEAIENIDSIIEATDGIMVARGDLGVEIPMYQVPIWQKKIIAKCNNIAKPVIVATHMMESMRESPVPTRAETNDVANAVVDGADALMLSAESASGKFPVESVTKMSETILMVEKSIDIYNKFDVTNQKIVKESCDHLVRAACRLSDTTGAKAFVCMTKSGYTGFRIAMHRPRALVFLVTEDEQVMRQMSLVWGINSLHSATYDNLETTFSAIEGRLKENSIVEKGDVFIGTASTPKHWKGHTNMLKLNLVE